MSYNLKYNRSVLDPSSSFRKGIILDSQGNTSNLQRRYTNYDYKNEPTFLGFKFHIAGLTIDDDGKNELKIDDDNSFGEDSETKFPESPLFDINTPSGAYQYLKNKGYNDKAKNLIELRSVLSDITSQYPWFFQSVTGLKDVWKSGCDMSKPFRGFNQKVTFQTLESLDLSITFIADLYRSVCYDQYYMKEILPDNLRWFKAYVYVSEWRNIDADDNVYYKISGTGGDNVMYENVFASEAQQYLSFELNMCEFDFSDTVPFDSLSNGKIPEQATNSFIIKPGYIREKSIYGLQIKNELKATEPTENSSNDTENNSTNSTYNKIRQSKKAEKATSSIFKDYWREQIVNTFDDEGGSPMAANDIYNTLGATNKNKPGYATHDYAFLSKAGKNADNYITLSNNIDTDAKSYLRKITRSTNEHGALGDISDAIYNIAGAYDNVRSVWNSFSKAIQNPKKALNDLGDSILNTSAVQNVISDWKYAKSTVEDAIDVFKGNASYIKQGEENTSKYTMVSSGKKATSSNLESSMGYYTRNEDKSVSLYENGSIYENVGSKSKITPSISTFEKGYDKEDIDNKTNKITTSNFEDGYEKEDIDNKTDTFSESNFEDGYTKEDIDNKTDYITESNFEDGYTKESNTHSSVSQSKSAFENGWTKSQNKATGKATQSSINSKDIL